MDGGENATGLAANFFLLSLCTSREGAAFARDPPHLTSFSHLDFKAYAATMTADHLSPSQLLKQAGTGFVPEDEKLPTKVVGGGLSAGKGVAPSAWLDPDLHPITFQPIQTATWDINLRVEQWAKFQQTHPDSRPPPTIFKAMAAAGINSTAPADDDGGQWQCHIIGPCQPCPSDSVSRMTADRAARC